EVAQLADDGGDASRGQEISGDHPGDQREAAEIGGDGRQSRGDDGLVERRQEQRQEGADDDGADVGGGESGHRGPAGMGSPRATPGGTAASSLNAPARGDI